MKFIVGLGNPGNEYSETKHNIGFKVIDEICSKLNIYLNKKKYNGIFYKDTEFIIAKPLTYMNNSGHFVVSMMQYFKIDIKDLLVIYDDMDYKVGQAVIKSSGSSAGQKGMQSIIDQLGQNNFNRLKIGIGKPNSKNVVNYVLSTFTPLDKPVINNIIQMSATAAIEFLDENIEKVSQKFNEKYKKISISN